MDILYFFIELVYIYNLNLCITLYSVKKYFNLQHIVYLKQFIQEKRLNNFTNKTKTQKI